MASPAELSRIAAQLHQAGESVRQSAEALERTRPPRIVHLLSAEQSQPPVDAKEQRIRAAKRHLRAETREMLRPYHEAFAAELDNRRPPTNVAKWVNASELPFFGTQHSMWRSVMDVYGNQLEWDAADADSSYRLHLSYLALQSGGDVVTEFGAAETGRGEYPQVTEVSCLCNTVEVTDITCSTYTRGSNGLKNSPRTERRNFMDNVWDSPLGTTYVLGVPQGADEVYFVEHGEPSTAPISIERYLQEVDAIVSTIPEASR